LSQQVICLSLVSVINAGEIKSNFINKFDIPIDIEILTRAFLNQEVIEKFTLKEKSNHIFILPEKYYASDILMKASAKGLEGLEKKFNPYKRTPNPLRDTPKIAPKNIILQPKTIIGINIEDIPLT